MGNRPLSRSVNKQSVPSQAISVVSSVPPSNISWDDTVAYIPPVSIGRVIKVYDGDTMTIACCLHGDSTVERYYRFSVRLAGIDTPEMKSRNPTEKSLATAAQTALSNLVLHQLVTLRNVKFEKYGRLLADVYVTDNSTGKELHVNQYMLDRGYAVYYDGGAKPEWSVDS
jgi:endonuclease YncB( thermonuclease family)